MNVATDVAPKLPGDTVDRASVDGPLHFATVAAMAHAIAGGGAISKSLLLQLAWR